MPGWLKNILLIIILVGVIILSFWISFLVGKQMLVPVKKLPTGFTVTGEATLPPPLTPDKISIEVVTEGITVPLKEVEPSPPPPPKVAKKKAPPSGKFCVQTGVFSSYTNAQNLRKKLSGKGFSAKVLKYGKYYRVIAGENISLSEAKGMAARLRASGFEAIVRRN